MEINPTKCIMLSYVCNNGITTEFPDEVISIPRAMHIILIDVFEWRGEIIRSTPESMVVTSTVPGRRDWHTFSGREADMLVLHQAADFYRQCRKDISKALSCIEKVIAPTGVLIDQQSFGKICAALAMGSGQACLAMLLVCGVTDQFDLVRGLAYFRVLKEDRRGFGTLEFASLLELYLEHPRGRLSDLMDALGI